MQEQFGTIVLKMNLRGIFLVKCLVVLFFCVKGSANEDGKVYGVLGASAFLNIPDFDVKTPFETKWLKNASLLMKVKNYSQTSYRNEDQERFKIFINGTLQIEHLVKEDGGVYTVQVYDDKGAQQVEKNLILSFQEIVSKPEIKWICSNKILIVTCEVNQKNQPILKLFRNTQLQVTEAKYVNDKWKIEHKNKILTGKFQCEVKNDVSTKTENQEIKCSGLDMLLILSIAGGAVVFVIFLALLIYCIRKKRAERYEEQVADEERLMQIQQAGNELKQRALPQPPAPGPQKQPRKQQRLPPQSQTPYQAGPPRPRPRTHPKSPNHTKERS